MQDFKQRYGDWVLITGGTSGIGNAIAQHLARAGMNVALVARTQASLDAAARALEADHGVQTRTIAADLVTPTGLQKVFDETADLEIAMLVPCAAIEFNGYFVAEAPERHAALVQMDVVAPMSMVHHFGRLMSARGRGAILLVSSLSGWMAQPYLSHYAAAKAYVLALGDSLHHEMKDQGVDVAVLSPGPTDTPMAASTGIDFRSMGMAIMTPQDVAAAGLSALGRRAHAIPGVRNRIMAFMVTRLMPRRLAGWMMHKMMRKALSLPPHAALSSRA